jgi:serine/threonine protein kinase
MIGEGGFGVVYRGQHLSLQHPIAVKCLKTPAHFSPQARDAFFAKFREEGQLLSRLRDCPGVVHVYDFGVTGTRLGQPAPYLVLEWLDGQTLEAHLAQRRSGGQGLLSLPDAVALLMPVFDALAFAHRMKIAHRDIKPANIFLANTARGLAVKVLDFGIAKAMQEGDNAQQATTGTGSGFQAFSPQHGAPEQFFSKRYGASGPWTDVHALALVLVEAITGRPALQGDDMAELLTCATAPERPTPRNRGLWVSDPLEAVFARALAVVPTQRFPDAEQFYEALRQALHASGLPVPGPLPSLASAYEPAPAVTPVQPVALPNSTPSPAPVAVGGWQQPPAVGFTASPHPGATEIPGYTTPYGGISTERPGFTTPAPGGVQGTEVAWASGTPVGGMQTGTPVGGTPVGGMQTGTQVGGVQIPWTPPTPPVVPPVAPRATRSSGVPVWLVGGLLMLGGGGLGLAGLGFFWYQRSQDPPEQRDRTRSISVTRLTEVARWIEEGRDVFAIGPLQQGEQLGKWHYRISREGGEARMVEKIRPSGAIAEVILFERTKEGRRRILRDGRGVEQLRTVYQEDGTAVTTQRSGEVIDRGCARVQLMYGTSGDLEERRCLSPTGVPVTDEEGCPVWQFTYDGEHRQLSSACFQVEEGGPQGRPAENKDGFHLVKYQYDASGAKVREQFFDGTGASVARLSDGCYGIRLGYDAAGNHTSSTCLDATGAPQRQRGQQVATTRWDFDGNGCVVRQSYADVTGAPAKQGEIAAFQVRRDEHCSVLSISLHGEDGALVRDESQGERVALREHEYNDRGDRILSRCYDEKRAPMDCGGFPRQEGAMVRLSVDERGRVTSKKHFFLDGKPSRYPGGYPHETRMTYGEDGRLATQTFLDEQGALATALGPVGRIAMRYDAMGNVLSQTFFGVNGVPVESSIGCHEVRYTYDPRNRLSSVECRSTSGDLKVHEGWRQGGIDWPNGAARMVVERGDVLVNIYSRPDGTVVKRIECKKGEQLCYR